MSMSDIDFSSNGGDYKNFRQISRHRLLYEMLRTSNPEDSKSTWKVLIMDKVTVKVMSSSCKMADITDEGVSLVEDLFRRRQPLPSMDAIYFIQPSKENVIMFLSDMSGRVPLYRKAYIFFSSPVRKELINHIKCDTSVIPRIGALGEMNLEYFSIDSQGFITDQERALEDLFGESVENSRTFDICLNTMATRIATVFASLKEFPCVRYRAKSLNGSTTATFRDLVPTKLAAAIWDCLEKYKTSIPNYPQTETCDLLIIDRSVDQIAPIIHEWTYDAMCHDLLEMEGNKYVYEVPSKSGGDPEKKEILLEEHDPVWLELRHAHIADASERLHDKMTNFVSKNKAAQLQQGSRDGSEISTRDLQKMVQALPQYNEQMDKLTLHVEIAGKINKIIRDKGLRELGQLEQDLVFGDAGTKEIINYLRSNQDADYENKLRLLMIYSSVHPDKFEGDKAVKLMQLAKLSPEDMNAVKNMRLLEGLSESKKSSAGSFALKFDAHKRKQAVRKDRTGEEETWQLFRFYPLLEELIEKLSKGELPKNEYVCMNESTPTQGGTRSTTTPSSVSAMDHGGSGASFPVVFFDGEIEIDIGDVSLHPSLEFKTFQSIISQKIGISPHQISIYFDCPKKSRSYPDRRRRIPITAKFNFAVILHQRDCFFQVVLKRSRRERRRTHKGFQEDEETIFHTPAVNKLSSPIAPEKLMLLRRDSNPILISPYSDYLSNIYDPIAALDLQIKREKYLTAMRNSSSCYRRSTAVMDRVVCEACCGAKDGLAPPFHWCVYDAVTVGFRSPAGPIARPAKSSN